MTSVILLAVGIALFGALAGLLVYSAYDTRRAVRRWEEEREEEQRRARARMLDDVEEDLATLSRRTWRNQ